MSWKDNHKSEYVQNPSKKIKKITGLWEKPYYKHNKYMKKMMSGRLNIRALENFMAYGCDTILYVLPNTERRLKTKRHPTHWLVAMNIKDLSNIKKPS